MGTMGLSLDYNNFESQSVSRQTFHSSDHNNPR